MLNCNFLEFETALLFVFDQSLGCRTSSNEPYRGCYEGLDQKSEIN